MTYAQLDALSPEQDFPEDAVITISEITRQELRDEGVILSDMLADEPDELRDGLAFEQLIMSSDILPGCFARHYTPEFLERFIEEIEKTSEKLAKYPDTYLESTAQELAAHAIIDFARDRNDEENSGDAREEIAADLEGLHSDAFEDHDVLMLFQPSMDGIEGTDVAAAMGMANLHPDDWFKPFRESETTA